MPSMMEEAKKDVKYLRREIVIPQILYKQEGGELDTTYIGKEKNNP